MNMGISTRKGKVIKTCIVSCLAVAVVWGFFSWPLPLHFDDAIPSSSSSRDEFAVRGMVQGDHLQLLYYYWLNADMLTGGTPFFHDLYQFNIGDDADRRFVAFDQYPFVLFFLPGYLLAGRAVGWNLMILVSMWITLIFTWSWIRFYAKRDVTAFLAALITLSLPYYWAMMMGGSPAGFAMAWVPMLLYGIELYLRRGSVWGGVWLSLAILLALLNDAHVFFFSVLLGLGWGALVFVTQVATRWPSLKKWKARIYATIPIGATAALVLAMTYFKQDAIAESSKGGVRSWHEVALYSPKSCGLYAWDTVGHESSIFLGYLLIAILALGLLWSLIRFFGKPSQRWREASTHLVLIVAVAGIIVLALGTCGPHGGGVLDWARRVLPPYAMIRQPAKIFTVIAPLLALGLWFPLERLYETVARWRFWLAPALAGMVVLLLVAEQARQVRPQLCELDDEQEAYRAVAEDARADGVAPHAIILPIWPGESSWASIYQHYVSLYRIKMVNGYLPVIPESYVEGVYRRFESLNTGSIDQEQLDALESIGVRYIVLHEDAYPEKISCFPVGFALKRLLQDRRLQLLYQDENVWAFKIGAGAVRETPALQEGNVFFPTLFFEIEGRAGSGAQVLESADASDGGYLLSEPGAEAVMPVIEHIRAEDAKIAVRCRGEGLLHARMSYDNGLVDVAEVSVDRDEWDWIFIPLTNPLGSASVEIALAAGSGKLDLDMMLYTAGDAEEFYNADQYELKAPLFFHAGYTDLDANAVVLRPDYEAADYIFYGPRLPFRPGRYEIELNLAADADDGTELGFFEMRVGELVFGPFPAIAGKVARAEFELASGDNLPTTLYFKYNRSCLVKIGSVRWKRLPVKAEADGRVGSE